MANKHLSPEDERAIVSWYVDDGLVAQKVAELAGVDRFRVYAVLRKYGVVCRHGGQALMDRLSAKQLEEFKAQYEDGVTLNKLAATWNCATITILHLVKDLGLTRRVGERPPNIDPIIFDAAIEEYVQGGSIDKILGEYHINRPALYQELYRRGIPLRRNVLRDQRREKVNELRAKKGLPPLG